MMTSVGLLHCLNVHTQSQTVLANIAEGCVLPEQGVQRVGRGEWKKPTDSAQGKSQQTLKNLSKHIGALRQKPKLMECLLRDVYLPQQDK